MIQSYLVDIPLIIRIHWVKNRSKTERLVVISWETNPWFNYCDPNWELICCSKWHSGTSQVSTPPELAIGTHFHVQHITKTTQYLYMKMEKPLGKYFPSSVFLLLGGTMQIVNTYPCVLKLIGQVWESHKTISINTNHSYHQCSSP